MDVAGLLDQPLTGADLRRLAGGDGADGARFVGFAFEEFGLAAAHGVGERARVDPRVLGINRRGRLLLWQTWKHDISRTSLECRYEFCFVNESGDIILTMKTTIARTNNNSCLSPASHSMRNGIVITFKYPSHSHHYLQNLSGHYVDPHNKTKTNV